MKNKRRQKGFLTLACPLEVLAQRRAMSFMHSVIVKGSKRTSSDWKGKHTINYTLQIKGRVYKLPYFLE